MSELPKEWLLKEIGEVGDIVAGGTPSTKNADYWGKDVSWITPFDLSGYTKKYIEYGRKGLTHLGLRNSSARLMPKGSVLFSSRAPIGYVAIARNELATNQGFKSLVPFPLVDSEYTYYYFKSIKMMAESFASGTTFKELSAARFSKLSIPVPSKKEQLTIVAKIEELFSDLDNAIDNLKKAQEQLKVYRQAIFWKGFEGGFTGGDKDWKTCKLSDVCVLIDGDRGKNYPKKYELLKDGYCLFLSAKNVRPNGFEFNVNIFISREKHEKLRSGTLQKGDVVITTRGTIGNVALYDESVHFPVVRLNSGMLILRLKTRELLDKYLAVFLRSPLFVWQIRKNRSGTAQPQLPANVLEDFEIKIPPVDIQSLIIEETDSRLSVCDQAESVIEENLQKAEALRQSIFKHAFDGRLTEQWRKKHKDLISGENSAEALLKKIKIEKEALQAKPKGKKKHD